MQSTRSLGTVTIWYFYFILLGTRRDASDVVFGVSVACLHWTFTQHGLMDMTSPAVLPYFLDSNSFRWPRVVVP